MKVLKTILKKHPALIYDNEGYDNIDKSTLSELDLKAIEEINSILKEKIEGYKYFQNFKPRKDGTFAIRCQCAYSPHFTGVVYIPMEDIN